MPTLLWDASALIKRYTLEAGSDTVDALFAATAAVRMVATYWGYAETFASLCRKRNRGDVTPAFFQSAISLLRVEIRLSPGWTLLTIADAAVLGGVDFIARHNINTTGAALLSTYLQYAQSPPPGAGTRVLIAADRRLLRAAAAEGLATLDPGTVAAADALTLLARW